MPDGAERLKEGSKEKKNQLSTAAVCTHTYTYYTDIHIIYIIN